jgi:hypothetical protein
MMRVQCVSFLSPDDAYLGEKMSELVTAAGLAVTVSALPCSVKSHYHRLKLSKEGETCSYCVG